MPDRAYLKSIDPELIPGARNAVNVCLRLKPKERITIITDAATREIAARMAATKVLAISGDRNRRFAADVFKAGASGYVLKASSFAELIVAVLAVDAGRTYISPDIYHPLDPNMASARAPRYVPRKFDGKSSGANAEKS